MGVLKARVKLQDLVDGLNAFNLPASDMSSVLRAIHAAGAMHAQLEIR
ncbi:MAG: flagellar basal body P-ring protein FlgI [Holosporaceae bacterium]